MLANETGVSRVVLDSSLGDARAVSQGLLGAVTYLKSGNHTLRG